MPSDASPDSARLFQKILLATLSIACLAVGGISFYLNWQMTDRAIHRQRGQQTAVTLAMANLLEQGSCTLRAEAWPGWATPHPEGAGRDFILDHQGTWLGPPDDPIHPLRSNPAFQEALNQPNQGPGQPISRILPAFAAGEDAQLTTLRLNNGWLVGHLDSLAGIREEVHGQVARIGSLMGVTILVTGLIGLVALYALHLRSQWLEEELARQAGASETRLQEHSAQLAAQLAQANTALQWEITERRQEEAEHDRFFLCSPDLMWVANGEEKILRLNPALAALLEDPAESLAGRTYLETIHPEDRPRLQQECRRLLAEEGQISGITCRLLARSGTTIPVEWSLAGQQDRLYAVGRPRPT